MIKRLCELLAKVLPLDAIEVEGKPYLNRYYIAGPDPSGGFPDGMRKRFAWLPITIYIHHFLSDDRDRRLHTHPWKFWGMILTGGYHEYTLDGENWYGAGSVNKFGLEHAHRIVLGEKDTWTLATHGPKLGPWGFVNEDGSIDYESGK